MSSQQEASGRVVLIPGDGIGPEVTEATVGVLEALGGDANLDDFTRAVIDPLD